MPGQKFGVGSLVGTTKTDAQGNVLAVPQSFRFGILQEIGTEFSFEGKPLHGSSIFPVDRGRGKGKAAFSAKVAKIDIAGLAAFHFGLTPATGYKGPKFDDAVTVPASPYQVTVTPPDSGTFVADVGVADVSGNPYKRVASAPAAGQYSVSAGGQYTFAAADTGKALLVSYEYSVASAGQIMQLTNQLMGYSPSFSAVLLNDSKGSKLAMKLNNCQSDKLTLPFKNEDYVIADFGFEAFDDGTGSLGYWSLM